MINNWHVPRNKRKLTPVVDVLSVFALQNLGDIWQGDRGRQLDFEAELERMQLKRPGPRRNQLGGGARTYESWLSTLGLTFKEQATGFTRLTMAGEALINGQPPVPIIKHQLMKYQYPSPYSVRSGVSIAERFKVRPFRFMLRLLMDMEIGQLSKAEIGRFVITEGENETPKCFEYVKQRILDFRIFGDSILPTNLPDLYPSSTTGVRTFDDTVGALEDNANTFINYLEYTQLITRDTPSSPIYIPESKRDEVEAILADGTILKPLQQNNPYWEENFQRSFGLLAGQNRDNRRFDQQTVNGNAIAARMVQNQYFQMARNQVISEVTPAVIQEISTATGIPETVVEEVLDHTQVDPFSLFETSYVDMAFSGRELAREFELSTIDVFKMLGYQASHIGTSPRMPDVFIESPIGYAGIIDNKAYHEFSITHDYELKMKSSYIPAFQSKTPPVNLTFFMYIAGGFGININQQVQKLAAETGVNGCVIKASDLMRLLRKHERNPINQTKLKHLFECNRRITLQDIDAL